MFHADTESFNRYYNVYETFYLMATFIVYTLMAVFLLPLIQIYTGGIRDAEYTNAPLVFLFVLMNLLACGKLPVNHVLEYAGKFKETRSHAIVEMTVNIAVSVAAIVSSSYTPGSATTTLPDARPSRSGADVIFAPSAGASFRPRRGIR